jgi:pyridoxal phosphate enzyme (YggS family)
MYYANLWSVDMGIAANLISLQKEIPEKVKIVAVSKTMPISAIREAYECGQRDFGENKVQEMVDKQAQLPADIAWHMIGHLQTNKVKPIIPFVHLIHSVDSLRLLSVINYEASGLNKRIDCLIQIRIAREESKFGMTCDDADQLFSSAEFKSFNHVRITGLMGMASFTDDLDQVKNEFSILASCFTDFRERFFQYDPDFRELSMGMSGDYPVAVETGSTMVRIGSLIFGKREPMK